MLPPQPSDAFLRRSRWAGITGFIVCGVAWLSLALWVLYTGPDRLGPGRFIGAQALIVATATFLFMWWSSTVYLRQRLDLLTSTGLDGTTALDGRPRLVERGGR